MSVKINDLARELQLSKATISKALKDSYEISPETKQRVIDLARRLNYTPNPYASSLRKRSSKTIAVVVPEVADSFFSLSINGIESVAKEKGFHVLIYLTHEDLHMEQSILRDFRNGRVDGVLLSVSQETDNHQHIQELCGNQMPLVFFDRVCPDVTAAKVQTDDQASGYKATAHLLESGCKKIAFLSIGKNLSIIQNRVQGFCHALADAGEQYNQHCLVHCPADEAEAYQLIQALLNSNERPDGIIGSVEKLATLTYSISQDLGLQIPSDIKVVGFSNMKTAALLNPSLTTITQPAYEMGKAAASLLFSALEKPRFNLREENRVLPSVLVKRGSTERR